MNKSIVLAITGASGIPIAIELLKQLLILDCEVHLVFSNAGIITFNHEMGTKLSINPEKCKENLALNYKLEKIDNLFVYRNSDWFSPIASGSSIGESMVICPCSMSTLAKVANGISDDLLTRAADVIIKERKNLILVPRETPLSVIHLDNMKSLSKLGVSILPPVLTFYHHPKDINDLIIFIVIKILNQLDIKHNLKKFWGN